MQDKTMLGELSQSHTTAERGSRERVVLRWADSIEGRAASPLSAVLLHPSTGVEQGCGRLMHLPPDTFRPCVPLRLRIYPSSEEPKLLRDPWEVPLLTSLGRAVLSSDAAAR
jgi:hypothetical protein